MLNPVFRRELNTALRSWKTYGALTVYILLLAAVERIFIASISNNYGYYNYNSGFNPQETTQLYAILAGFQFVLIMIITPALTAGSIAGERERQTLNLMLITKMSTFKIAVGKLLSSLSVILLLIIASMPVFAMIFYYGGVSVLDLAAIILYTILSAAAMGSICIFLSSLFKRTVSATVMSYLTIMVLCIGTFVAAFLSYMFFRFAMGNAIFSTYGGTTTVINADPTTVPLSATVSKAILIFIFSFNPFAGFLSIIDTQLGTGIVDDLFYELSYDFSYNYGAQAFTSVNLWVYNVIFNVIIIAIMLFLTSKVLTPVKASRKNK
ncbi:ABC transporter permease subunit [Tyzzerella sp. OttesenSCG-928-J15]|nr:ABC transporter permease subunit [Tyzzerella sp. OttesenSCG-928-J15]